MKTKWLLFLLLIPLFACTTQSTSPLSKAEKDKIQGEVKAAANEIRKACDEVNADALTGAILDSPDFLYMMNGNVITHKEFVENVKPIFAEMKSQKITILDEQFAFPDNTSVLYVANYTDTVHYKDGRVTLDESGIWTMLFKNTDKGWKMAYGSETFITRPLLDKSTGGLNQMELVKQFAGTWKGEMGKDTSFVWSSNGEFKDNVLLFDLKMMVKGKLISEGKSSVVYDKRSGKFIETEHIKGSDPVVYAWWFTTNNMINSVMIHDIATPDKAAMNATLEFSKDGTAKQVFYKSEKEVWSVNYTRQK